MSQIVLPDCARLRIDEGLLPRQRRELVRLLAEEGAGALEAWLRKEEKLDPTIRRRLAAERARLEREARAERERLERGHAEEDASSESSWESRMRGAAQREQDLMDRLATVRGATLGRADLVRDSALFRSILERPARPPWWRRLLRWLRGLLVLLVSLWVRLVRKVTGRPARVRNVVVLPEGAQVSFTGLGPDAVLVVAGGGWRERLRRAWDRLLGREDYAEEVARRMEEERRRLEEEHRRRRDEEERRLQEQLKEAKAEGTRTGRDAEQERQRRRQRQEAELARLADRQRAAPYEALRDALMDDLRASGHVDEEGRPTHRLLERFSRLLYEEARQTVPAGGETTPGHYVEGEGEYEPGPLRSEHEIGAMDLVQSYLHARLHHPHVRHIYDDDIIVHREVRSATAHVVIVFDTSGSMELEGRLEAAKRMCLVLVRAVKDRNPDHDVDLLQMQTSVSLVDLAGCWNAKPHGFTNVQSALRHARRLLEEKAADHKLLYLITDGLPEAYTRDDGVDKADRPDVCTPLALEEARRLREVPGLRTTVLQLETRDPLYLSAAADLAEAAAGRVEGVDPARLTQWVLGDYADSEREAAR